MRRYTIRPLAWREIEEHLQYLENEAGIDIAEQFLTALITTFTRLAATPKMGVLCNFRRPALRQLRRWPVKDFENWLIFYRPRRDGVEIVRLIHGARNIVALLDN